MFYTEIVKPLILLPHVAALVVEGSEVLVYDTERSTEHNWKTRVTILVCEDGVDVVS